MFANFSILGGQMVVCIYRWKWLWFLNTIVQKTSLPVLVTTRLQQPLGPGPLKFVRCVMSTI